MSDELTVCAAAFFRNKGKNVITETEFLMVVSMDLHWMPHGNAKLLLKALLSKGILLRNGDYLRPSFDVSEIDVPVAYRPSEKFIASLKPIPEEDAPTPKRAVSSGNGILDEMISVASAAGIQKRTFVSESNAVSKRLDIDMLAAGLIVLRDKGVDIAPFVGPVYEAMKKK